jgi:hypothetical protein
MIQLLLGKSLVPRDSHSAYAMRTNSFKVLSLNERTETTLRLKPRRVDMITKRQEANLIINL